VEQDGCWECEHWFTEYACDAFYGCGERQLFSSNDWDCLAAEAPFCGCCDDVYEVFDGYRLNKGFFVAEGCEEWDGVCCVDYVSDEVVTFTVDDSWFENGVVKS